MEEKVPLTGFEPSISHVRSNRPANCAIVTPSQNKIVFVLQTFKAEIKFEQIKESRRTSPVDENALSCCC